jgi:hypothetical protein
MLVSDNQSQTGRETTRGANAVSVWSSMVIKNALHTIEAALQKL